MVQCILLNINKCIADYGYSKLATETTKIFEVAMKNKPYRLLMTATDPWFPGFLDDPVAT